MKHLAFALTAVLAGCVVTPTAINPYVATSTEAVTRLALSPGGGAMGEAVAAQLTAQGFSIMPAAATDTLMQQQGLASLERPQLGGLSFLRASAVDAVLIVRGPEAGAPLTSARATVLRVSDGRAIAESHWQGRFRLAPPDRMVRGAAAEAIESDVAARLAADIARRLRG